MAKENDQTANGTEGGGPSFHPGLDKKKAPKNGASSEVGDKGSDKGPILKKDQVPPL